MFWRHDRCDSGPPYFFSVCNVLDVPEMQYNKKLTPRLSGISIHPLPELHLNISRVYTNALIKCYNTRTVTHSYFYNYNRTKTYVFRLLILAFSITFRN